MSQVSDAFTVLESDADGSSSVGASDFKAKRNSITLSIPVFIIFCLCAVALSVIVGLIVHYAPPDKVCNCVDNAATLPPTTPLQTTTTPASTDRPNEDVIWEMCLNMSAARNECLPAPPCHLTTEMPTTTTAPPTVEYRLPLNLIPSHYDVELRPYFYDNNPASFWFEGNVSMQLQCQISTNLVIVHKRSINVTQVEVTDAHSSTPIDVRETTFDERLEFFTIRLGITLTPGDEILVRISYNGPLKLDMQGMYYSDYNMGGETKYMIATQLQSTDARKAFPCLDEPALKATFNITLQHQGHMKALSNMPFFADEVMTDGWHRTRFAKTSVVMPTYLVAFAIAEYDHIENYANSSLALSTKHMRYWANPFEVSQGHVDWAAAISPPMFDFLENYFNLAFPLPKTDQIVIPDYAGGAMENWGLITYSKTRFLFDTNYTTTYTKQRMTGTIGHELLHMWLGNVVTCNWWSETWLNEGMARFHQHEAMGYANPTWNMDEIYATQVFYAALNSDSTGSSYPLTNTEVYSPIDADNMFSSITYDKGSAIIRMCRDFIGKTAFDNGMRAYVDKMKYRNSIEDDLFAAWEDQFTMTPSVGDILRTWTNQMGYPLVTFTCSPDGGNVHISQKMYLLDPEAPIVEKFPSKYKYTWHVPVRYTSSKNTGVTLEWLNRGNKTITLSPALGESDWILGNVGQIGFYRVNYDPLNWRALSSQLQTDHNVFHVLNRAQLIHDSHALARSGEIQQVTALETLRYLPSEESYLPFNAMTLGATYLDGMLSRNPAYSSYKKFLLSLIESSYTRLGWQETHAENLTVTYLRNLILETACRHKHQDCINFALLLMNQWRLDPLNMTVIRPDIRPAVYCTAAREAGEETWEWLLQQYLQVDEVTETPALRDSLSCTQEPWLLSRLFTMALDKAIKSEDRVAVMLSVARNINGKDIVWQNLNTHWDTLPSKTSILSAVSEYYYTQAEYDKVLKFTEKKADDLIGLSEGILRKVKANMKWAQANLD